MADFETLFVAKLHRPICNSFSDNDPVADFETLRIGAERFGETWGCFSDNDPVADFET